jgi:hypothetical protein
MSDLSAEELANLQLERTLNLVQKFRQGARLQREDREIVDAWFAEQKQKTLEGDRFSYLCSVLRDITLAAHREDQVPLTKADDLTVIRGTAERLAVHVKKANEAGLRVRWMAAGALVCIGLPTMKVPSPH